ncbi:MAG: winged helix-turn-helix domain-containing protein [Bacteroides thetaiotaomicron]|nr:winged helix-turn-helix domain-containing protein [Bacteroides thetaiotaomicron]
MVHLYYIKSKRIVKNYGKIYCKFTAAEEQIVRRPGGVTERVTEQELKVIELLQEDPGYTYAELAEKLSVSRKTISERIKKLREKKVIERVGSATKGYWKILN